MEFIADAKSSLEAFGKIDVNFPGGREISIPAPPAPSPRIKARSPAAAAAAAASTQAAPADVSMSAEGDGVGGVYGTVSLPDVGVSLADFEPGDVTGSGVKRRISGGLRQSSTASGVPAADAGSSWGLAVVPLHASECPLATLHPGRGQASCNVPAVECGLQSSARSYCLMCSPVDQLQARLKVHAGRLTLVEAYLSRLHIP